MEERKTEQSLRGGWRPGFYMRPKHVGLVFCVSVVGCMVTFGVGFIVGMGYKASEQVSPYAVIKTPGSESVMQGRVANAAWNNEGVIFYDSLTDINKVPMETKMAPEPPAPGPARTPVPTSPVEPAVANGTAPQFPEERIAAGDGIHEHAPVIPVPATVSRDGTLESPTVGGNGASSVGTAERAKTTYSVQLASFRSLERAERMIKDLTSKGHHAYVHPFDAPGQPLWYRVKVGRFPDRATASLKMEELGDSDAMITRD